MHGHNADGGSSRGLCRPWFATPIPTDRRDASISSRPCDGAPTLRCPAGRPPSGAGEFAPMGSFPASERTKARS